MTPDRAKSSLELLYNIGRQLVSSLDLQTVLDRVLYLSIQNIGAERGMLFVLDKHQQVAQAAIVANQQLIASSSEELRQVFEQGLAGWVLRNREPALVANTSRDERWVRRPDDADNRSGAKSAICIPLMARDEIVGVLTLVHPQPGFFKASHLELLQAIGDQAGTAINNARLYDSLQEVNQRYRELFENSIDPIVITNRAGTVLEVNRPAQRLAGNTGSELLGLSILDLHEPNWEKLGENFSNLRSGEKVSYESSLHLPAASPAPVEVHVYQVHLQGEDDLQWILRDIAERKELDALRMDLAAMIYHDLRSPLSNIISSLDMLETLLPKEEGESLHSLFGIAVRSTGRLQRLINSLLDINRLEAGQPITNQKKVTVQALVNEAVDTVRANIDGKQQQLTLMMMPDPPDLWVDEDMIRRVCINLLENAIKFTPPNGKIEVRVDTIDDKVRFCVQDSGPGMPVDANEYIFQKFRRLNTEGYPKGFGLGLAFCQLAVQTHGGRIWVESEIGLGSRFYFILPAAQEV